jgi:hypothetical protein
MRDRTRVAPRFVVNDEEGSEFSPLHGDAASEAILWERIETGNPVWLIAGRGVRPCALKSPVIPGLPQE